MWLKNYSMCKRAREQSIFSRKGSKGRRDLVLSSKDFMDGDVEGGWALVRAAQKAELDEISWYISLCLRTNFLKVQLLDKMGSGANTLLPLSCMYLWCGGKPDTMWEFGYNNLVCKTMALHLPENFRNHDFLQVKGVLNLYNEVKENSEFRILDLSLDLKFKLCYFYKTPFPHVKWYDDSACLTLFYERIRWDSVCEVLHCFWKDVINC